MGTLARDNLATAAPRAVGSGAAAAPPAESGAPPSNRASDSCTGPRFEVLSRHVDSLELSYRGSLKTSVARQLDGLKSIAQSTDLDEQSKAQLVSGDETFAVHERGARYFPYVVENGAFRLKLAARTKASPMPCAYCQVRSEYLVQVGPVQTELELGRILSGLVDLSAPGTVSRIDLALDLCTDFDMEGWSRKAWVTRLRAKTSYSDGERFTGWKLGTHRNPVSMRVYDKSLEIRNVSGKVFLYDLWERNGHIPWDAVWRVEGEFRREALRVSGFNTLSQTVAALGGLWRHLTEDVVRLCVPNADDETRGRWALHPFWAQVAAVAWDDDTRALTSVRRPSAAPSDEYFVRHHKALATSMMARDGYKKPIDAAVALVKLLQRDLERDSAFTGKTPVEALNRIAAAKARRYFTRRNVLPGTPAPPAPLSDAARAYRDASRGR
jgi:hypothetical protein